MANIVGSYTADTATITAGKQLGFKLGLESKLTSTSFTAQEGVFYLTSDTHRLFIGIAGGNIAPVNQGVIHVDAVPDAKNAIPGQFYYIDGSNILATYNGSRWVQINPDTYVKSMANTVASGTSNDAKVVTSVTHGGGQADTVSSNGFNIKGGGDIKVTADATNRIVTLTDAPYGLSATGDATGIDINLMKTPAGESETIADKVTLKSSDGIALTRNGDEITIDGKALVNANTQNTIKSAAFSNEAQGFKLTLTKGNSQTIPATVDPIIHYGSNNTEIHFVNGVADLDVYTREETDTKIKNELQAFNALMYKGTVGGSSASISDLPTSGVHNGDVYMSTGNGDITVDGVAKKYDAGTLFIAKGDEDTSGTNAGTIPTSKLEWTIVSNYNTDTQAKVDLIDYGIKISNTAGSATTELGGLTVKSGTTDILNISQATNGKTKELTVSHLSSGYEVIPAESFTPDSKKHLLAKKVLTAVGADAYGHLETSTEEWVTVPTEVFKETDITEAVAVDGTSATLSHSLTLKTPANVEISTAKVTTNIVSDTLKMEVSSGALAMNLVWGSFE